MIIKFYRIYENRRLKIRNVIYKKQRKKKREGKQLLNYGIKNYNVNFLGFNEQYSQAIAFYEHMEFKIYKRTNLDVQGNHYLILCMKLDNKQLVYIL